ncbi:MAG: hypothetical protein CMC82_00615 [Flavobacteriaceae bacterium]|nr:hypothetical protein [Flavobacteriaceae bacterium]|tara:strand:- start:3138 stop:3404 length:267 start_codon:yes stop_codon:yes gene_type:complete
MGQNSAYIQRYKRLPTQCWVQQMLSLLFPLHKIYTISLPKSIYLLEPYPKKQLAQFAGTILALTATDGKALLVMNTRAYNALAYNQMV